MDPTMGYTSLPHALRNLLLLRMHKRTRSPCEFILSVNILVVRVRTCQPTQDMLKQESTSNARKVAQCDCCEGLRNAFIISFKSVSSDTQGMRPQKIVEPLLSYYQYGMLRASTSEVVARCMLSTAAIFCCALCSYAYFAYTR
jgi:hypothetical protein